MTGQDYTTTARVIRKLRCDRLVVAEHFAAMFAKEDPHFNRNRFLTAALWGIERRADGAVAGLHRRSGNATTHANHRAPNGARTLMRPLVNARPTADTIRKLVASLINRLAEPIPPT